MQLHQQDWNRLGRCGMHYCYHRWNQNARPTWYIGSAISLVEWRLEGVEQEQQQSLPEEEVVVVVERQRLVEEARKIFWLVLVNGAKKAAEVMAPKPQIQKPGTVQVGQQPQEELWRRRELREQHWRPHQALQS